MSFIGTWAGVGAKLAQFLSEESPVTTVQVVRPASMEPPVLDSKDVAKSPVSMAVPLSVRNIPSNTLWTPRHSQTPSPDLRLASGRIVAGARTEQAVLTAAQKEYEDRLRSIDKMPVSDRKDYRDWYELGSSYGRWVMLRDEWEQLLTMLQNEPDRVYSVQDDFAELPPLVRAMVAPFRGDSQVKLRIVQAVGPEGVMGQIHLFREQKTGPDAHPEKIASASTQGGSQSPSSPFSGLSVVMASGVGLYLVLESSMKMLEVPPEYSTPYMLGVPAVGLGLSNAVGITQTPLMSLVEGLPLFLLAQGSISLTLDRISQSLWLKDSVARVFLSKEHHANGVIGMMGGIAVSHVLPKVAPKSADALARAATPVVALILGDSIAGVAQAEAVTDFYNATSRAWGSDLRWTPGNPIDRAARHAVLSDHFFSKSVAELLPNVSELLLRFKTRFGGSGDVDLWMKQARRQGRDLAKDQVEANEDILLGLAITLGENFTLDNYERTLRNYYERPDRELSLMSFQLIKIYGDYESNSAGPVADFYQALHYNEDRTALSVDRYFLKKVLLRAASRVLAQRFELQEKLLSHYGIDPGLLEEDFDPKKWELFLKTATPEARDFLFGSMDTQSLLGEGSAVRQQIASPADDSPYVRLRREIVALSALISNLESMRAKAISVASEENSV